MRSSLRKLRGFALHHHSRHGGEQQQQQPQQQQQDKKENAGDLRLRRRAQLDELVKASQDMLDMRDCYDSLLSAAAATANSAYEFSESLHEMGACLLEKTALNDDEESGKVLLMLGKVQFELQKLVDNYRSHIFQTITIPSESLLNELRTVEEMKRQCDEKRDAYEFMMRRQKEKGRGRGGKGESISMQQLQAAHEEYDEEATSFVFRLKSLKLGQSRSLLTQAARHHAAQLSFFKKALKSLETVEPHVKSVTEHQHIDYHFSGLEEDEGLGDDDDDDDGAYDVPDDGELSFDYGQNDQEQELSASRQSMELDTADLTFPHVATVESSKENIEGNYRNSLSFKGDIRTGSKSAPLFAESKLDPTDRFKQMRQPSTKKFNTYVLPTPGDTKSSNATASGSLVPHTSKPALSGRMQNLWHSSPIEPKIYEQLLGQRKHSASTVINSQSVLRESNNNTAQIRRPPPLADLVFSGTDPLAASDSKKIKRHAFSGPISSKPWPNKPASVEHPQLFSGPLLQNPMAQLPSSSPPKVSPRVSPMVSPSASPTFVSSPKINELHELPRPPASSASKSSRPLSLVGYSAPLAPKGQVLPASSKLSVSSVASPLPTPSQVTRSFSIPSSGLRAMALKVSRPLEATKNSEVSEDVASPPLTPISLLKPSSTGADADKHTVQL